MFWGSDSFHRYSHYNKGITIFMSQLAIEVDLLFDNPALHVVWQSLKFFKQFINISFDSNTIRNLSVLLLLALKVLWNDACRTGKNLKQKACSSKAIRIGIWNLTLDLCFNAHSLVYVQHGQLLFAYQTC